MCGILKFGTKVGRVYNMIVTEYGLHGSTFRPRPHVIVSLDLRYLKYSASFLNGVNYNLGGISLRREVSI